MDYLDLLILSIKFTVSSVIVITKELIIPKVLTISCRHSIFTKIPLVLHNHILS
uniref:Uncharacterized protein n=1 Tax=virus sp. ctPYc18 TaxID=2828251 RepID=A0A8S5RDJ3_9VIRU|nr:MAG TPA: hypothetical protein [virus sp. ctPYc18]